jgi:hypothetical protein
LVFIFGIEDLLSDTALGGPRYRDASTTHDRFWVLLLLAA